MKKNIKVIALIVGIVVLGVVGLIVGIAVSNGNNTPDEPVIESIQVVESSIPEQIYVDEVNSKLTNIKIKVLKSDDTTEEVNLSTSMISAADLAKLSAEGTHTIKVTYEGLETSLTIVVAKKDTGGSEPDDQTIEYNVIIEDIAGKPLADFYVWFKKDGKVVAE